ncbi:hypothetical protein TMatcc_008011 [Talaromyces marneffei ATCC 18224]|uniref:Zn(2)-C6 fungal-type domain-containing protein n=4 Tax=Talaromyces marneffei TaxID=37727 RepID=B6QE64_TALMQ|nr:conserved hypothetical protein [Talaromyces marneffei ATCC 18224]KAE8552618.1 hypothetical protein EYB25_003997 [Talaromyces marneffei]
MHTATAASQRHNRTSEVTNEGSVPRKRRARYALRACDECKRRKGRCDGHTPCEYCRKRSIGCHYDEDPRFLQNCACGESGLREISNDPVAEGDQRNANEIERLTTLVENMQKQIDMLVNIRTLHNNEHEQTVYPARASHAHAVTHTRPAVSVHKHPALDYHTPDKDITVFCGATSSEYTFNMAERNIAEQHIDPIPQQSMSASKHSPYFAEKQATHHDNSNSIGSQQPIKTSQAPCSCYCEYCTRSLRMLTKAEALRLVDIYGEVVGNLHPFFNQERFKSQVELVYTALESTQEAGIDRQWNVDSDTLDNIKVALAIPLLALGIGNSDIGTSLYASVQDKVQNAVFSPIKSVQKIVLLLLAGMYHYFHDDLQLAWRTCGIAGKAAMEMGLHRQDAILHMIEDEAERVEVVNVMWNIVVLDKQWSCAAGLPHHFSDEGFPRTLPERVENPYLKAMISYASFYTRFWDFSGSMQTVGACEDEELFDTTNYQIEQWRKRSLAELYFVHPKDRTTSAPESLPQSMPTLLYLRANQLRGLIIRSCFLSGSSIAGSPQIAQSGMEFACDTIQILADLDATTDLYAKQHPFFQHFLASAIALLLLVIATESKKDTSFKPTDLPFSVSLSESIARAFRLTASYFNVSAPSRRLLKRMMSMVEPLSKLGIVYPTVSANKDLTYLSLQSQVNNEHFQDPQNYTQGNAPQLVEGTMNSTGPFYNVSQHEVFPDIYATGGAPGMMHSMFAPYSLTDTDYDPFGAFESMMEDRTWMELNTLFSLDTQ